MLVFNPRYLRAASSTWRVIHALVLRDARSRYGKYRAGYLWALMEPLIQMAVLWGFFELLHRRVPVHASMPVFLLTGIFVYTAWRSTGQRGADAIRSNKPLLTHPQVQPAFLVLAVVLLDLVTYAVMVLLSVMVLWIYFDEPLASWTDEPLHLMSALGALALLAFGWAMFNGQVARIWPVWSNIVKAFGRVMFFTSGIFYTMDSLPHAARKVILLNPLAHMIEWIRSAALPGFESTHYSMAYVIGWGIWLLFWGLAFDWILRLTGHTDHA